MPITVACRCGRELKARDEFAGTRAECPYCGTELTIPSLDTAPEPVPVGTSAGDAQMQDKVSDFVAGATFRRQGAPPKPEPVEIRDFLDPPTSPSPAPAAAVPTEPVLKRMLDALLDPRAIQWLLMLGGGLFVLGLIIWLVSIGVFKDPRTVALVMGLGSVATLAAGWFVTLKTSHKTAGHAITFLGCVVLPLNLWFYHAQDLVTLEGNLWLGGLVCVAFYVATVFLLRSPLFMYAVEAGVTLTMLLLMASLGQMRGAADFCFWLMGLAFVSILAERGFAPDGEFSRRRYGLPLFWSGQVQLAASLLILLASQTAHWLFEPLGLTWTGNLLTENTLLAGGLWIVGAFLYVYSDVVVRQLKVYSVLAAFCVLMAFVTTILPHLHQEAIIALLAIVALAAHIAGRTLAVGKPDVQRNLSTAATLLSLVPVLMGLLLHARATSRLVAAADFGYQTGWWFVGAMLVVAITNRISAYLCRSEEPKLSATYFMFSAAGAIVAAAGLLRQLDLTAWSQQAPLLMLIPLAYLIASRMYRGQYAERPLQIVAHVATAVILFGVFWAALERDPQSLFVSVQGATQNLLLGVALVEASLFYVIAGLWQHRTRNVFGATACGCAALWQFLGYFGLATVWYPLMFAVAGVGLLLAARSLGLQIAERYQTHGGVELRLRGPGLTAFYSGNAVLTVALVAAFMKGLGGLGSAIDWLELFALIATTAASAFAVVLVPGQTGWRQWYTTATAALAGVTVLTLNVLIDLSGWQKLEIFLVICGVILLVLSTIGRFREAGESGDESVTMGLALGSLLAVGPLFLAMLWHRWDAGPSMWDEIALLTISVLMLAAGLVAQMKAPTLLGGAALVLYLMILIGSIVHRPQVAIGVYMMAGAALLFAAGVLASIYRDRLLELPERIARREGIFRVINWR
jgi:hypothetical protein